MKISKESKELLLFITKEMIRFQQSKNLRVGILQKPYLYVIPHNTICVDANDEIHLLWKAI